MESHHPNPARLVGNRRRCQYSLRTLLIAAAALSVWLSWQAYQAEQQASATVALERLGGYVNSVTREPRWLWKLFGERFGETVQDAGVDYDKVQTAIPYFKRFPGLQQVIVYRHFPCPPADTDSVARAALLVREALPDVGVDVFCTYDPAGWDITQPTGSERQSWASPSQLR